MCAIATEKSINLWNHDCHEKEKQNRLESIERSLQIDQLIHGQLIVDKIVQSTHLGDNILLSKWR
jgi:hypothetical protein